MKEITKKLVDAGVIIFNENSQNSWVYSVSDNYILVCFNDVFDKFIEIYKEDDIDKLYSYMVTGRGGEEFIEFMDEENFLNRLEIYKKENILTVKNQK